MNFTYLAPHDWRRVERRCLGPRPLICAVFLFSGCSLERLRTQERLDRGLVLILPGIEGPSVFNEDIARGLDDGGVDIAIEVRNWGTPVPGGMLINLADAQRNARQAAKIADEIVAYKKHHPGRPVHLIGHSAGAGIAVMALERLPADVSVTSAVLIAAAVSPEHDLTEALLHTESGIRNYYSRLDMGLLGVGTAVFGTVDRDFTTAAGASGFRVPYGASDRTRRAYVRLEQVPWEPELIKEGHSGDHFGWTHRRIVARHIAPGIGARVQESRRGAIVTGASPPG